MLKGSSGVSSRSRPGHSEEAGQRRARVPEEGLALDGGVRGEPALLSRWWSRRELRLRRRGSFCMLDMRKGRGGDILREDWCREWAIRDLVYTY